MRRILVIATIVALATGALGAAAGAQGIDVTSQTVRNQFPDGVLFSLVASADSPIEEVRLRYTIETPEGSAAFGEPECSGSRTVQCSFNLRSMGSSFLIPKTDITYSWEVRDGAGKVLTTEAETFTYEDDRFRWDSLADGNVTVWFYDASTRDVEDLLRVSHETLTTMGDILNTRVEFPVKVLYYASAEDMQQAIRRQQDDGGPITLGEVVYSDTAIVSRDVAPLDIVRHELTHVVVRQAVKGPFGDPPAWLDEGLAVWAQSEPLAGEQAALDLAIRRNRPFSIRSLTSSSLAQSDDVSLFYGQSYSIVSFLIDEYGEEKLGELFATLRDGARTDAALEAVYGFDQDGLEDAWRESVGLPSAERGTPVAGGQARPVPQLTPFGAGDGQQSPPPPEEDASPEAAPAAGGDGDGAPVATVAVVLAVTVLLAAVIGAGGYLVLRRR